MSDSLTTITDTLPDIVLMQSTLETKNDGLSFNFCTVDAKTWIRGAAVFYAYHTLLAALLLAAAYISGTLPLGTTEDMFTCCAYCMMIVIGFFTQLCAIPLPSNCAGDIVPLWVWQFYVLLGLFPDGVYYASTTSSLYVVVLIAFFMLIHIWLILMVGSVIHFLKKKEKTEENIGSDIQIFMNK